MGATLLVFGADTIGKLLTSLGTRTLGDEIKGVMTARRMSRLVQDAVDKIVEQVDDYLTGERVDEQRKELLITAICTRLQPLVDDPQQLFAADLDGAKIFKHCHPDGLLPERVLPALSERSGLSTDASRLALNIVTDLGHVPDDALARYTLVRVLEPLLAGDDRKTSETIDEWLAQFPSQRSRLLFLLLGLIRGGNAYVLALSGVDC